MKDRQLPESVYNWTSVIGAAMAVISFGLILLTLMIEVFVESSTPDRKSVV